MSIFTRTTTCTTPTVNITYEAAFGRVATVADGTGTHTYGYVPFNAADTVYGDGGLKYISTAGGTGFASATVTYIYDVLGRRKQMDLQAMSDAALSSTWTWDGLGRLTAYSTPVGIEVPNYSGITDRVTDEHTSTNGYEYDDAGRLAKWTKGATGVNLNPASVSKAWTMGYDASEQLESIVEMTSTNGGAAAQTDLMVYGYDAAGNRTNEQEGGGVRQWSANAFNQLTSQNVGGKLELRGAVTPRSTVKIDGQPAEMRNEGAVAASGTEWRKGVVAASGANSYALEAREDAPPGLIPQVVTRTISVTVTPAATVTFSYDADGNLATDGLTGWSELRTSQLLGFALPFGAAYASRCWLGAMLGSAFALPLTPPPSAARTWG